MTRRIWTWALLPALVVMGCAKGTEEAPLHIELFRTSKEIFAQRRAAKTAPAQPVVTRAQINALRQTALEIRVEQSGTVGYVFETVVSDDPLPGRVTAWRSVDDIALTTRNGMLIATRGLGGDILSSTVQASGQVPGPARDGEHIQMIRELDDREVSYAFGCELTDLGAQTIEIYDHRHATRHLRQSCEGRKGDIVNEYWIGGGKVWKSRQWAGPFIGYVEMIRLNN